MANERLTAPAGEAVARIPSGVLVLAAIISIQTGASIAVKLFASVGPGGAVFLRLCVAAAALIIIWRPRWRSASAGDWRLAALFGVALGAMNLSFYAAINRLPLGIAVSIEFIGPLAVAVLGSRRKIDFLWVALAALGIVALTHPAAHAIDGLGAAFALIAGVFWGIYILVGARVGRAFEHGTGLAFAMLVAALVALPAGLADGGAHLLRLHSLLLGAAVGLLSSAIPYTFELEALRRIRPAVFGVLMSLEPAVAAVAGFLVLSQGLSARGLAGIALVVAASIGASRSALQAPLAV